MTTVDVGADAVVLLVAFTGKPLPYAIFPVNIGLAAVDVDIGIMSCVDSKSVRYVVVPVNIGLTAADVDIGVMSGVDSKSVPLDVAPVNEAIPPLFGTPDSDLFKGYSVRRTLVRGTPTKVQMVRVRRILCSARNNP